MGSESSTDPEHGGHRRRVVWTTAGITTVALLLAGVAYAVQRESAAAPVAEPTASRTTAPTPTPAAPPAVVLPTGDPALPFGTCGALADAAPAAPVETIGFSADLRLDASTVTAGEPLGLQTHWQVTGEAAPPYVFVPSAGPRLAVLRDGVVVAAGDLYEGRDIGDDLIYPYTDAGVVNYRGALDLAVCDDGTSTAGAPLPAGSYSLVTWDVFTTATEDDDAAQKLNAGEITIEQAADLAAATARTSIGEPVLFTVTGEATQARATPWTDIPLVPSPNTASVQTCGKPAPAAPATSWMFELQVVPGPTTIPAGSPLRVDGTLRYSGPDRVSVGVAYTVDYVVVRDGVVVGSTLQPMDGWMSGEDLGHGVTMPVAEESPLLACDEEWGDSTGEPLPAGTYTVYPAQYLGGIHHNGVSMASDDLEWLEGTVYGTPFEVTLT